jgi:hypothetical protein
MIVLLSDAGDQYEFDPNKASLGTVLSDASLTLTSK